MVLASHGPWNASFRISISSAEANEWRDRLGWGHSHAGQVVAPSISPGNACDQILLAARLAKGLTLLTDGTAYDVTTQAYFNPSDWKDLPLDQFRISDHLRIEQTEADRAGHDWFLTLGLAKFGLEELETFMPGWSQVKSAVQVTFLMLLGKFTVGVNSAPQRNPLPLQLVGRLTNQPLPTS